MRKIIRGLLLLPAIIIAIIGITGGLLFAGAAWLWEETGMYKYWEWDINFKKVL